MPKKYIYIGGNGSVFAISTRDGSVLWSTELKSGWIKTGSSFVSLMEDGKSLYAFAYGIFYMIDKGSGKIIVKGNEIKKLKNHAGVFSVNPLASTGGVIVVSSDGGDGSGDGGGDSGDGGGGGD